MASSFLEQKAKKQAEKLEKQYGSSAYGGTTWLNEQISGKKKKKKKDEDIAPVKSGRSGVKTKQVGRYTLGGGNKEDIAPIKTRGAKEDEGFDFFQKGTFEDGYQAWDVSKAILGTAGDATVGVVKGASKLVEGILDAGRYGVAGIADVTGHDDYANKLRVKAKENAIDNAFKKTDSYLDRYSLLGRTSDAVAEGIGQVGTIILTGGLAGAAGLGVAGTTAVTTGAMGVSSMGSGMSEAYESGATDEEAAVYGLIKGVVDAGSEMIFGGLGKTVKALGLSKGLSSLDDVFAQKLASKITNHVAKNFVEFGVKASAEGVEEVLAGIGSAVGKKLTYMDEKKLSELVKDENLMEQFVVGAVTSGISQSGLVPGMKGGSLKESIETGRDFVSGLSENEQKVAEKEFDNRVAEAEKDGKISKKEKDKIYDDVLKDMEKGRISIDTIEEVLGGETYQNYQNTVKNEDSLRETFNQLNQMKQGDMTGEQIDLRNELKEQLKALESQGQRNQLKSQLDSEVMGLAQNTRLAESYNERARKGQAFEADLTQYDEKQKTVIQKAIDSGILNNTNRTHEFVDMIAKISADKGVLFDFANNQKLKDSGFAIDGKTVNGFVTKDGVTLNIDSAKSLNSVVGHEITHVLEGTEVYTELQNILKTYAESKGEYQSRYDALTKLYEGVEDANIDAELTADLVGDYLFTDEDFIHNLSTNHRNVFQKIYDEIKYLYKVATAGSKEARELEKVKRAFEKAYKEGGKVSDTKYSLGYHAGDLGKAEPYIEQGYYRGTGHFGTGTYFTGDESKISDSTYGNRPHHSVEFDNYNLYRVRNDKDGYELHDNLKVIDGGFTSQEFLEAAKAKEMSASNLRSSAWERAEGYDEQVWNDELEMLVSSDYIGANIRAFTEVANENGVEIQSYDEWFAEQSLDESDYDYYKAEYYDYLKETLETVDSEKNKGYDKFRDAYFHLWLRFGQDNVNRALQNVIEYDAKMDASDNDTKRTADSLATVFMKSLGYEGIDVRGTGLDNTTYGSVIYDLKGDDLARKKEIGTAKFSISDSDYQDAVNRGDTDTAQKMVNEAAETAMADSAIRGEDGKLLPVYHGTWEKFNVFDTSISGGKNGTAEGFGIYTSDNSEVTSAYGDRQLRMYADIKKPARSDQLTITSSKLAKLIKDTCQREAQKFVDDGDHDNLREAIRDTWISNYVDTYSVSIETAYREVAKSILDMNSSDMDVVQEVMVGMAIRDYADAMQFYKNSLTPITGFDGIWTQWEDADGKKSNIILAFDSSQLKQADHVTYDDNGNVIPLSERFNTENQDIRYSLSDEGEQVAPVGGYNVYGKDIALAQNEKQATSDIASDNSPVSEVVSAESEVAPVVERTTPTTLYGKRDGKNGWGKAYATAQEALNDAVQYVDRELWDAFNDEIDNTPRNKPLPRGSMPVTDAFVAVQEDVRQETITPMQGAQLLSEAYKHGGVNTLRGLYNPHTGNLYSRYLEQAKQDGTFAFNDLLDIAKQARRENMRGAYTHNGKQYLSDGSFIAEFNTVDESLEQSKDFPVKQAIKELDESFARQAEGKYDLHTSDTKGFIKVGNSLFGSKRVNALIRAFENPEFSLANVRGGHEALLVTADNGRAVLMPVRASGNAYLVYEAQPIAEAATFPDDLAPMTDDAGRFESLTDEDAPPEMEAPITEEVPFENGEAVDAADPFADRDVPYGTEGRKQKAYMYENPEVKPFFQAEAYALLEELNNGTKGEKWYNDQLFYESGGEQGWGGTKRDQSESIDRLTYEFDLSYDEIEKGLKAIIEDNGAENIAAAKKIEFVINDRLMYGYKPFGPMLPPDAGMPNQDYIALMQDKQRVESLSDEYAPPVEEDIAPIREMPIAPTPPVSTPPVEPTPTADDAPIKEQPQVAKIRRAEPQKESWWRRVKEKFAGAKKTFNEAVSMLGDKGFAFENLSKKTGNREVEAKYDFMKNRVKGQAQEYVRERLLPIYDRVQEFGEQKANVTPIVEVNGKTVTDYQEQFDYYAYHLHNIDRMSLETEAERVRREEIRKQLDGYTEKQIESLASETITRNTPQDRVNQIYLAQEYIDLGGAKGKNKAVYDSSVTAEVSRKKVAEYEAANPEFKELEQAILEYNKALRDFAVNQGLITQSVADKWAKMYPHYVPIRRTDRQGKSVSVPLDSNRTGVNNPFKRAQGGNSDFVPLLDAMAMNTEQIFYAVARNDFGRELMGALETSAAMDAEKSMDAESRKAINAGSIEPGTRVKAHDRENIGTVKAFNRKTGEYTVYFQNQHGGSATVQLGGNILTPLYTQQRSGKDVDTSEILESTETNDNAILEPGKNGQPPQFTVFVKGKPVTFDITEEMYKAMKPADGILSETYAVPNAIASGYKKVLTEYDPFFALFRNPIKDTKDVLFNSQHAAKTYMTAPKTMKELATKGKYYQEFIRNGGKSQTYYDTKEMAFTDAVNEKTNPYRKAADNFEMFWRLSEYIASREAGRSEKVSMLDAARVTTNFGAGGDFTKWLNRNGALFLNPSVQGVMQIGRNVREAYHGGLKGGAILAAKVLATGLGGMFFNWLLWDDDEEYEELSDYVKQNYFVIWKTEDGKFIRIPKGRMEAVIQNGFEQMQNLITGDDDVDMATFADLVANNLAPNNPLKNNLFSPIQQALSNTAWYGDDIVPTRLQDVPAAEQYDESTDAISKWIGEKANISPYKVNYVLGQYGGGFADMVLPMFTPKAEGNSLLAPIADEFMSDSTLKNQNVSDFYKKVDELTVNANSSKATDEVVLMSKYMTAKNSELSALYQQKRDIQNGFMSDAAKYEAVREIQNQINSLAKESLNSYENVTIDGVYAKVGDVQFRWYEPGEDSTAEPGWKKLTDEQLEKQDEVTSGLGIDAAEYWSNQGEYDFAYDYPEKYKFFTDNGISYEDYKNADEDGKRAYTWAYENPGKYTMSKVISDDFFEYYGYKSKLNDIKGVDNDGDGRSDSGTAKEKKLAYINGLDLEYGQRLILYRSMYSSKEDKRKYNNAIVEYINGRDDLTYEDRIAILKELDFEVSADGTKVYW